MKSSRQDTVTPQAFGKLWTSCFSYVKIRAVKAVTGKCTTCAALSHIRRTYTDAQSRECITLLHALHRTMYMGERLSYYDKRNEALLYPSTVWSLIGDGMAQQHCQLPYLAGLKDIDQLPQHLQGMLIHGKLMQVYRTFHNVKNDSNLQMHTFLLTIEHLILKSNGQLPETIYYQVDGGSVNTARVMMGLAELIVAKGIVRKLIITRLPVGHTHEDIDSKFAKIWVMLRSQHVATMSAYKDLIIKALSGTGQKANEPCEVIDIFVVPDYFSLLEPAMDTKFGRYAKLQWTQLQWSFEKVDVCAAFPLGVKTLYRAYCQDVVNEIVEDANFDLGYVRQTCQVEWFPKQTAEAPAGMFVLQRFPTGELLPEPFVEGSRATLEHVTKRVISHFSPITKSNNQPVQPLVGSSIRRYGDLIVAEWTNFTDNIAPVSDDAAEYCRENPFHVPLLDVLFGDACATSLFTQPAAKSVVPVTDTRATDSVNWSRRGQKRSKGDPAQNSSRETILDDVDDSVVDDGASNSSHDDSCNYHPLTNKQRQTVQCKAFLKYIHRTFRDTDEEDGDIIEGLVTGIVMETSSRSLCFEYCDKQSGETNYIISKYAVKNCEFLPISENDDGDGGSDDDDEIKQNLNKSSSKQKATSKWPGWVELSGTEKAPAALLDNSNVVVIGKRQRKQVSSANKI